MSQRLPLCIGVLNQKGGVGKTTLATNLAAAFQLGGQRTLLMDLDTQGSSLDWNTARAEGSKLDGLAAVKHDKPLVLARFRSITAGFDVVVLDGPPRLGDITRSAAMLSDLVLVPIQPSHLDFWATGETLKLLDEADGMREQVGLPPSRRQFVMSRAIASTTFARTSQRPLSERGTIAAVAFHQRIAFMDAMGIGESVLTTCPNDKAAFEVRGLHREILKTLQGAA